MAGLPPARAAAFIREAGLTVAGFRTVEGSPGIVVGTTPPEGEVVPVDSGVVLLVGAPDEGEDGGPGPHRDGPGKGPRGDHGKEKGKGE